MCYIALKYNCIWKIISLPLGKFKITKTFIALERLLFHTQEKRHIRLKKPIFCYNSDAWLGNAYYFWYDETDAIHWGNNYKRRTLSFEIYKADVECDKILDTVFNEDHYKFWVLQIEKAASAIIKKTGSKASIREINQFFIEKVNLKKDIDGVMFQDLPFSPDLLVVNFNYRKRIQVAVYNSKIINNFVFHSEMVCL